jgi:hypothetical protein
MAPYRLRSSGVKLRDRLLFPLFDLPGLELCYYGRQPRSQRLFEAEGLLYGNERHIEFDP